MSNDGLYQTAITRSCKEKERKSALLKTDTNPYFTDLKSKTLISSLRCTQKFCGIIEKFSNMNTEVTFSWHYRMRIISEEGHGTRHCHSAPSSSSFVTHFVCTGSHCDDKALICKRIRSDAGIRITNEYEWTGWISSSEHMTGKGGCSEDYYLTGIKCKGRFCESMKMRCRKIEVRIISNRMFPIFKIYQTDLICFEDFASF